MSMLLAFTAALAAAGLPLAPATPTTTSTTASISRTSVVSDPVVCEMTEVTGSSFAKRLCLHKSEWAARAHADQDSMQDAARMSTVSRTPSH